MKKQILSFWSVNKHPHLVGVFRFFIRLLISILGPKVAGTLCSLFVECVERNTTEALFVLSRDHMEKDFQEFIKKCPYTIFYLKRGYTFFQSVWTPEQMQIQTYYQMYQGPQKEKAQSYSVVFAKSVLKSFLKNKKIISIISGNIDYWQDYGFKVVAKENKIPFVVIAKENPIIPDVIDWFISWNKAFRYKFEGDAICLAGELAFESMKDSKVCDENKLFLTGLPRFDPWLERNQAGRMASNIVFFTFTEGYGVTKERAMAVLNDFVNAVSDKKLSDKNIIIKAKDENDLYEIKKFVNLRDKKNITLTCDSNVAAFIENAGLVFGYNSLVLIEAMYAKKPLFVPRLSEVPLSFQMLPESSFGEDPSLSYYELGSHLTEKIETRLQGGPVSDCSLLRSFVYCDPNETASEKILKVIIKKYEANQAH